MVVSDAISGKVITTVPIGDGCDGVAFDPATWEIFASNGEGTITVIQQADASKTSKVRDDQTGELKAKVVNTLQYEVLENFTTQQGARTITVDKTTHHIYVSGGEYGEGTGRRPVKPNTFKVLDIEPLK